MLKQFNGTFCWATGIENTFVPQARPGLRALDEYALTQHYQLWQSDLERVAETGVQAVRWGIPWYRVQPRPNEWNWRWVDEVLDYLVNVKGIIPILDLMHYGTPLWLENSFLNSRYPEAVAHYAGMVAARYQSLVHYYTPLNEPAVNAEFAGLRGQWPPYLTGDDGYVKILLTLAKGIVLTVQALQAEQPTMQTVQVEALRHHWTQLVTAQPQVATLNAQQYLAFDLVTGRVNEEYPLYLYLRTHGVNPADLAWFQEQAVRFDYFGANFYPWSYGELVARRGGAFYRLRRRTSGHALAHVLHEVQRRYDLPILVTETSCRGTIAQRAQWMDETIQAVAQVRGAGVPVVGYTWFPLFTMIDWAYRTGRRPLNHYLLHLGLYDSAYDEQGILQRHATPLVARYQQHMATSLPAIRRDASILVPSSDHLLVA
jgi:beta-glucosidase/6-phospho-beta-glucosidase/beta-galactosidase